VLHVDSSVFHNPSGIPALLVQVILLYKSTSTDPEEKDLQRPPVAAFIIIIHIVGPVRDPLSEKLK